MLRCAKAQRRPVPKSPSMTKPPSAIIAMLSSVRDRSIPESNHNANPAARVRTIFINGPITQWNFPSRGGFQHVDGSKKLAVAEFRLHPLGYRLMAIIDDAFLLIFTAGLFFIICVFFAS